MSLNCRLFGGVIQNKTAMRKIAITIIAMLLAVASASAISLKEAYAAISNAPDMSTVVNDAPSTIKIDSITDRLPEFKIATAYNLSAVKIFETGNAIFAILNQVPLSRMINGGNNQQAAAFVYAEPTADGKYDFLVVTMSGYSGDVCALYTVVNEATIDAFQNAKLTIEGPTLSLVPMKSPGANKFNIAIDTHR